MARFKVRTPASWRQRQPARAFTVDEDRELCAMVRCGLAVEHYALGLPERSFGELLERRLQLIEAGELQRARAI